MKTGAASEGNSQRATDSYRLRGDCERLVGVLTMLLFAALLCCLQAVLACVVVLIDRVYPFLSDFEIEPAVAILEAILGFAQGVGSYPTLLASVLVTLSLWRSASVRCRSMREALYWAAAMPFVFVFLGGILTIGDELAKVWTGMPMLNRDLAIWAIAKWAFPLLAALSGIACATIAIRFNTHLGGRLTSEFRMKLLASAGVILILAVPGFTLLARWLFPDPFGAPNVSSGFDWLFWPRHFVASWAWLAWQIWLLFELMSVRHRLKRFVRKGSCPKCGYDLRAGAFGGCPECGWERADSSDAA